MRISETQLQQVNSRIEALIAADNFYGKKLKAAGVSAVSTPEEFEALPFSEKSDLREAYPLGLMTAPEEEIVRIHSSSGTTGLPVIIPYTRKDVEDWAILGGGTMAHQFTHIGQHAMVGAGFKLVKDVPPYVLAGREPVSFEGVNRVGLSRRGFSEEKINEIKDIYETLYFKGMNVSDALAYIEQNFPKTEERDNIIAFIRGSKRGVINKPRPARG